MTIAWALGSGGLFGLALCSALRRDGTELFFPAEQFCWGSESELISQLAAAVRSFASEVDTATRWEVYWTAGLGTISSREEDLAPETRTLSLLRRNLEAEPCLMVASGAVAFASSAGAIYAGSVDDIITENSCPTPTNAYAREKLRQEVLVRSFAVDNSWRTALIARISTLYGSGQATGKQQGLMAHRARSILRNQLIQTYVPYDPIRDYIYADDAATAMISVLRSISENPCVMTKIVASGIPTTIAKIISIFKRNARRTPRIVTSASKLPALYARRVQFRSIALPECAKKTPTNPLYQYSRVC